MVNYHIKIKNGLKEILLAFSFILSAFSSRAQLVGPTMTGTPAAGSYYNYSSITLTNFSFTSSAGNSLKLYIASPDCQLLNTAASVGQNYTIASTPRSPGYVPGTNYSTCDLMQTVQYFDGLGRPLQTVQVKGSPLGNDIVQPNAYDQFGRAAVKYLPYAVPSSVASDGSYKTNALTPGAGQSSFYASPPAGVSVISNPLSVTNFEPSPLNRVVEQGAPGTAWQPIAGSTAGHTVKVSYASNDGTTYSAKQYSVNIDAGGNRTLAAQGTYAANQLYVTVSRDENWTSTQSDPRLSTTEEYKDKEGHVVLKRTYNLANPGTPMPFVEILSTYYVYDDLGNLAFVLPPLSGADNAMPTQTQLDNLCYQYQYDLRNRMSQKKLPGKGWEYMVYNVLDQVVATQDANQRAVSPQQWTFIKYDAQGREIISGIYLYAGTAGTNYRAALQTTVSGNSTLWETPVATSNGYSSLAWPLSWTGGTLQINYYDNYSIPGLPTLYSAPTGASISTTGLLTASQTNVLGSSNMLWAVHYYDNLGRSVKNFQQHYLGGTLSQYNYDAVSNSYDFTNEDTLTTRQHYTKNAGNTAAVLGVTITNRHTYDHVGRKKQTFESINGGTNVLLSQNDYNEVGQVLTKHLHSTDNGASFLQNIAYTYNERGWLLSSIAPLFQLQLQYNNSVISGVSISPQYNGNIASQSWGTQTAPNTKSYTYGYDQLNRLMAGNSTDNYNEGGITYDQSGNIQTMKRTMGSTTLIDNLSYNYTNATGDYTNQVQSISDIAPDNSIYGYKYGNNYAYQYDLNGNMRSDASKGITSIIYNLLNLPQSVTNAGGTATFTYDASGRKLRKVSTINGTNTDYIDGIEYDAGAITFIQTEEGRALNSGGNYHYEYTLGDHLGNSRLSFDTYGGSISTVQQDDYFPFGYEITRGTTVSPKNKYLYNKKELQDDLGQYDYGARFYDPVIARWNTIDPLAEINRRWSPYNYVLDNPIRFEDPDGMDWKDPNDKKIADRLQGEIASRLKTENGNLKSANDRVAKLEGKIAKDGSSKGLESRLASAKSDVASIGTTISDLNKSSSELTQMETTTKQTFAFNELPAGSEVGGTEKGKDGVITMGITGDANAIHEATHGFQIFSTGGITQAGRFDAEVSAYQRQYSFDSNSVTAHAPSDWGSIGGRSDITPNWVMGLHDNNSNYIYMPGFKPKDIRELFKQIRKTP